MRLTCSRIVSARVENSAAWETGEMLSSAAALSARAESIGCCDIGFGAFGAAGQLVLAA